MYKTFITSVVLIWFIPSVCTLVAYQTIFPCKTFKTAAALIWFIPSVCTFVYYQMHFACEAFITSVVFIWFISSMWSLVVYQIPFHNKRCFTIKALIWFITNMCSLVCYQVCLSVQHYWVLHWYGLTLVSNFNSTCVGYFNFMAILPSSVAFNSCLYCSWIECCSSFISKCE